MKCSFGLRFAPIALCEKNLLIWHCSPAILLFLTYQGEALKKILSGQAGGFFSALPNLIGENLGIRSVPIEFHTEGRHRALSIPKLLELRIEGVVGGDKNKESVILNPGFTVAPGYDPVIARSSKYSFNDYGMTWDNSGKNGFYSKFIYGP